VRIAIVHYHLRTGGVTRVIEHASRLLRRLGHEVVVLASGLPPEGFPATVVRVEELAYDEEASPREAEVLKNALLKGAVTGLGTAPDLWHIHNHHLGKNLALPQVVAEMAEEGQHLLLQIHNFPEDGRSYNYRRLRARFPKKAFERCLYPHADHVHYALINARDRGFLRSAGLDESRLHWLPNPVFLPQGEETVPGWPGRLWLYPTRAIRRKNIGEFLLWAAMAGPEDFFATSLAPENPREQAGYRSWVRLANELKLPVKFDLASQTSASFTALLRSAHCIVTTSITEGFGMAFLEPWLLERPVTGRDLPEITTDFIRAGVDLSALYARLEIPVEWIGERVLRAAVEQGLRSWWDHYQLAEPDEEALERAWRAWVVEGRVDFGRLDEAMQGWLIRHLAGSSEARQELTPRLRIPPHETLAHNRETVTRVFDEHLFGDRLCAAYQRLLASPCSAVGTLDSATVLDRFLQPERLYLLRL